MITDPPIITLLRDNTDPFAYVCEQRHEILDAYDMVVRWANLMESQLKTALASRTQ